MPLPDRLPDASTRWAEPVVHASNVMRMLTTLRQRARRLKADTFALYLAARHPATPWYVRLLVAVVVAYAFSPIDLIPDFIPVLGYLDDLVLVPLGIALVIRLIPASVLAECRTEAGQRLKDGKPVSRLAAVVIVSLWLAVAVAGSVWAFRAFTEGSSG